MAAGLDIDDNRMIAVDQIVGGIGEDGVAIQGPVHCPGGIRAPDELRLGLAGRGPGGLVIVQSARMDIKFLFVFRLYSVHPDEI